MIFWLDGYLRKVICDLSWYGWIDSPKEWHFVELQRFATKALPPFDWCDGKASCDSTWNKYVDLNGDTHWFFAESGMEVIDVGQLWLLPSWMEYHNESF